VSIFRMNFESRISDMNQLNNDHQLMNNNSSTPSNSLFDGHLQKYPISPLTAFSTSVGRDDSLRKNFELWKMELEENNRKVMF